eukprot:4361300-Pyramimonas_sp.AAC.1
MWPSVLPAPLEAGCPAAGSAACLPTVMSWLLAPAVGLALEPGLGAHKRTSGGAACASGGGAAAAAAAGGTCP